MEWKDEKEKKIKNKLVKIEKKKKKKKNNCLPYFEI